MTEARGKTEVGPSLRSRGVGRGLEGALAVSCLLQILLEERHLLQNRSPVASHSLRKEQQRMIEGPGLAVHSLHKDWLLLLRIREMLCSPGEKLLIPADFEVRYLWNVNW